MFCSPRSLRLFAALTLAALALSTLPETVHAQFGGGRREGGRFGGRGGFDRGGLLATLRDDAVQQELNLTDEQRQKIEELSESARPSRDFFSQFAQIRELPEEERDAKMAEIRQQREDRRREAESKLKEILNADQYARLQQTALRNAGARALLQDEVAEELKLAEEQRAQIREILESREGFNRDFRNTSPEDWQKRREEREAKALAVLTEEQRRDWEQKIGGKPESPPAAQTRSAAAQPVQSAPALPPSTTIRADGARDGGTVLKSFSADGTETPADGVKRLSFNFRGAPWADVLKMFAEAAGLTLDLNAVPEGTFSYYDRNEYTPTEALDILNGYLLPKGYVLVRRNNFLVSLKISDGIPPNLVPTVKVSELPERGRNELLSIILPLQEGLKPDVISKEVEGLLGPQGKVVPLASSNSLMIQDIGSNLRQVVELLSDISVPESDETFVFRRFPLEHMLATEAERQIRKLFGLEAATRNVSRAAESSRSSGSSSRSRSSFWERFRGRGGDDNDRDSRSNIAQLMAQPATPDIHVSSEPRTNSVLVKAKAADMKLIEEMLKEIDVPESADAKRVAGNNTPVLRVYKLGEAEAEEVAKTLDAIMPGVVINEDGRNDMVHVLATPREHEEIQVLIQRLDGAGGQTVDVIKLSRTDPTVMAQILGTLFANVDRDIAPAIQPDPITRTLVVRGSIDQIGQIRKVLQSYGEDGTGLNTARQGGRFRSVPLAGRDPERVARIVEGILSGSSEFSNEIRVVVPSDGPIREQRVPSATRRETPARPRETRRAADRESDPNLRTHRVEKPSVFMASLQDDPAGDASEDEQGEIDSVPEPVNPATAAEPARSEEARGSAPQVNIEVRDGELFLYSADEQALDEVEGLIDELAQQLPARSEWTIFYLRIADATEAASLLEQLVSSSSLLSSSSSSSPWSGYGYSSRYSSRSTVAAPLQSLKIIPDTRTNSLFVSGPTDKVREVEQFLRLIDAAETPESLRDRMPRTIPVRHADVLQVAQMIREIYKDYMEDPNARGGDRDRDRGGFSFFGRSSSGGNSRRSNVRLTLAVDTRTSELIVSCDDPLFREIEDLVAERDQAAYEGQPTVQVVELNPASAAMVQQALTSLSPKILVSTSGSPRTNGQNGQNNQTDQNASRSASNGSGDRSGGDGGRSDMFRRMMEMRMMERMRDGSSDPGRSDGGSSRWGSGGGSSDWRSRSGGSSRWGGRGRD